MIKGTDWTGNYSRFSFDETKKYFYMLKEQGVPVLDDEFNLLQEVNITYLRRLIEHLIGDGSNNDGFKIVGTGATNDFTIKAGKLVRDGWLVDLAADTTYGGQPETQAALTTPSGGDRTDEVYIDFWFEEIDSTEDSNIKDPTLATQTSCRLQLTWAVKVAEAGTTPAEYTDAQNKYHWIYKLAVLNRLNADATITAAMVVDNRGNTDVVRKTDVRMNFKIERAKFTYNGGSSTGTIKLSSGDYYCKDKFCWWDQELTTVQAASGTPTADTWYYLYLDYSAITDGIEITNAELIWSTTAPIWSNTYRAWMNGDDRCIMACRANVGGTNFLGFSHSNNLILFHEELGAAFVDTMPSNVWSEVTFTAPPFCTEILARLRGTYVDTDVLVHYRINGISSEGYAFSYVSSTSTEGYVTTNIITDSSQKIEMRFGAVTAGNTIGGATYGWYLPIGM